MLAGVSFGEKISGSRSHCENCGTPLAGHYCPKCGQPAIDYRRSFRHVIVDVLDSFLNWDSKFIATIGWLIVRPWRLTNEFLAGHRVRYLHPLRLYLLASILFFFAVNYWAKSIHIQAGKDGSADVRAEVEGDLQKAIHIQPSKDLLRDVRAEIEADLRKENLTLKERAKANARVETALKLAKQAPDTAATAKESITPKSSPDAAVKPEEAPKPESANDSISEQPVFQFGDDKEPKNEFEKWLQDRAKEKFGEHGTKAQLFFITPHQQPSLHDALLHPTLRLRSQDSLHSQTHLLHRSSCLRAAHPHLRVCRDHADRRH